MNNAVKDDSLVVGTIDERVVLEIDVVGCGVEICCFDKCCVRGFGVGR